MIGTVLLVLTMLLWIGTLPRWPYSRQWGYYPSLGVGMIMTFLIILLMMGLF